MAQFIGRRTTAQAITETRLVRKVIDVGDEGLLLEPNEQPLITLLMRMKKRGMTDSPRVEWFEEDFIARWGQNGGAAVSANAGSTTVNVVDGTVVVPRDVILVPQALTSSLSPELLLVTAVNVNALTVVRGYAGSTIRIIPANSGLCLIGTSHAEGAGVPEAKTYVPVPKITYTQIFRKSKKVTRTQAASKVYAALSGERKKQHARLMSEMKIDMNRFFLWGKASETLTDPTAPVRTTMGLNTAIATNITDAGGVLTRSGFEAWARQSFRYGKSQKILLAPPMLISALHSWGNAHMQLSAGATAFGVRLQRITTGHGEWLLVRDWMLEDGIAGQPGFSATAYSIEIDEMEALTLSGNGENRSLKLMLDVVKDGVDGYVDEAITEVALKIRHEKKFAKLFNVQGYAD